VKAVDAGAVEVLAPWMGMPGLELDGAEVLMVSLIYLARASDGAERLVSAGALEAVVAAMRKFATHAALQARGCMFWLRVQLRGKRRRRAKLAQSRQW
jgi:hypothetical protein